MTLILSGTNGLSDVDGSAATPAIRGTDANTGIFFPAADTIAFAEGGTEAARIDSSGNFLVGTTSNTGVDTGSQRLVVNGIGSNGAALGVIADTVGRGIRVTDSSKTYTAVYDMTTTLATLGTNQSIPLAFTTNGSERMRIDSSGNLLVGTTSSSGSGNLIAAGVYNNTTASGANVQVDNTGPGLLRRSTSSIVYKTDVEPIAPEYINNALKFRPVWYRSLCEGDRKDWSWYGLIAEEVGAVDPRLVHWRSLDTTVDANGNTVQTPLEKPVAEGVMYDRVVVLALGLIQEQQALITALTTRIEALEAK